MPTDYGREVAELMELRKLMLKLPWGKWTTAETDLHSQFMVKAHNYLWDMLRMDEYIEKYLKETAETYAVSRAPAPEKGDTQ